MDYGKLAYQKVEELQAHLVKTLKSERTVHRKFSATPYANLQKGDYALPTLYGNGSVTLIIKLAVRADNAVNGKISVKADEVTLADEKLNLLSGEEKEVLIIASPEVNGSVDLVVSAFDLPLTIKGVQVLINGNDADMSLSAERSSVDKFGDAWAIVESVNGEIFVRSFNEETQVFGDKIFLGEGKNADICATSDGFVVAYCDEYGNTFLDFLDAQLEKTGTITLLDDATAVAVGRDESVVVLAFVKQGELFVRKVSGNGVSQPKKVSVNGKAEEICFVKNAKSPSLIVYSSSRAVMTTALVEHGGRENITLTASIKMESV